MARQYLRKTEPYDQNPSSDWVMMTGSEFYSFISSSGGKGRYFIRWDDLVIEAPKAQYIEWLSDEEHTGYLREHEKGWNTLSLYSDLSCEGRNGEELVCDSVDDVELSAMANIRRRALVAALPLLDSGSFHLIYSLYLAPDKKTESELAAEVGISQQAVHKRKEKILRRLKFLVVKCEKSPQ